MLTLLLAIFSGAFLLFQVQPLLGKYILPWFGGGPAVWTTAVLFFQIFLLGGYAYAHLSVRRLSPRGQAILHLGLLAVGLAFLPVAPGEQWKPSGSGEPTIRILLLLTATVGLPYLLCAATSPLTQAWWSRLHPEIPPFRLYALSNLGSLLALVTYPFVLEPALGRHAQSLAWSGGFVLFVIVSAASALQLWRSPSATARVERDAGTPIEAPRGLDRALWVGLPAAASMLLLAVTNQITLDLAPVPFLWVLPLGLYLLSFVITFERERWYSRRVFAGALLPAAFTVVWLFENKTLSVPAQIGLYSIVLFVFCMAAHGELTRLKPDPRLLTSYYVSIAAGGALGGVFVAIVAPHVFSGFQELHVAVALGGLLVLVAVGADRRCMLHGGRPRWIWGLLGLVSVACLAALGRSALATSPGMLEQSRNFYGITRVVHAGTGTPDDRKVLYSGDMTHGLQFLAPERRREATTWYGKDSGVGMAFEALAGRSPWNVGLVGLGAGTLAAFGRPGDVFRFYEINPAVVHAAQTHFTFLADSKAQIEVVLGDARLSLEREPKQGFDLLVLDAFTSDSIPVHLLTLEAFELYASHMKPDGVIAVHLTNLHFDFFPVVRRQGKQLGWSVVPIHVEREDGWDSDWALLTRSDEVLDSPNVWIARLKAPVSPPAKLPWTDDYTNLMSCLK
jgi:hypothetical protein